MIKPPEKKEHNNDKKTINGIENMYKTNTMISKEVSKKQPV